MIKRLIKVVVEDTDLDENYDNLLFAIKSEMETILPLDVHRMEKGRLLEENGYDESYVCARSGHTVYRRDVKYLYQSSDKDLLDIVVSDELSRLKIREAASVEYIESLEKSLDECESKYDETPSHSFWERLKYLFGGKL